MTQNQTNLLANLERIVLFSGYPRTINGLTISARKTLNTRQAQFTYDGKRISRREAEDILGGISRNRKFTA